MSSSTTPAVVVQATGSSSYIEPNSIPEFEGPNGIRYDFNKGCRVFLPELKDGKLWRAQISDTETGNVLFEIANYPGGSIESTKKYYVPFKIECWIDRDSVFNHTLALQGEKVMIQVPVGTLGDSIGWFPYIDDFREKHNCKLTCVMSPLLIPLFKAQYPEIVFKSMKEKVDISGYYATYRLGLFFDDWGCTHQPSDFRYIGLHKTAAHILGVDPIEKPPKISLYTDLRTIKEPYVCIAVQSSTQCKYWNNPRGWIEIVRWLKDAGYRVLCIDKEAVYGAGQTWTSIPHGAEDMTGDLDITRRAALLKHADFFIGLSSGLSWLAWAAGTPVVMISGFTHPNNEFFTPYRVFNAHTCNSCWNDPRVMFDHFDFMWCPRHKGTDRQFECTKHITVEHVKKVVERVPGFLKISQTRKSRNSRERSHIAESDRD